MLVDLKQVHKVELGCDKQKLKGDKFRHLHASITRKLMENTQRMGLIFRHGQPYA